MFLAHSAFVLIVHFYSKPFFPISQFGLDLSKSLFNVLFCIHFFLLSDITESLAGLKKR